MFKKYGLIKKALPVFLIFLLSSPLFADAGVPMIFIGFPFMLLGLIPVIVIEIIVYYKRLTLGLKKLSLAVTAANAASTIIGYPLAWLFLLGIELLTTGGGILKAPDIIFKIMSVTLYSAWMLPAGKELNWMAPVAMIFELIPAYFLSVLIESWIIRRFYKNENRKDLQKTVWISNLFSYAFLVASLLVIMIFFIHSHSLV